VPRLNETARLVVHFGGVYGDSVVGQARVRLPAGVALVSGDTLITGHPRQELEWTLLLRSLSGGVRTIRGEMGIEEGYGRDEGEFELEYVVGDSSSKDKLARPVRREVLMGTKRFRYGGPYLVPIDSSEHVLQEDLDRHGGPTIVRRSTVADSLGIVVAVGATDSVGCIVFVARNGSVRDIRIIDGHRKVPGLKGLIYRAFMRDWEFEPVQWQGRSRDSWVFVRVPLRGL
jgi:hypothetical protein